MYFLTTEQVSQSNVELPFAKNIGVPERYSTRSIYFSIMSNFALCGFSKEQKKRIK